MRISDWSSDVCSSDLMAHDTLRRKGPRNIPIQEVLPMPSSVRQWLPHTMIRQKRCDLSASGEDDAVARFRAELFGGQVRREGGAPDPRGRSEGSGVGKECGSTCRCRRSQYQKKENKMREK